MELKSSLNRTCGKWKSRGNVCLLCALMCAQHACTVVWKLYGLLQRGTIVCPFTWILTGTPPPLLIFCSLILSVSPCHLQLGHPICQSSDSDVTPFGDVNTVVFSKSISMDFFFCVFYLWRPLSQVIPYCINWPRRVNIISSFFVVFTSTPHCYIKECEWFKITAKQDFLLNIKEALFLKHE